MYGTRTKCEALRESDTGRQAVVSVSTYGSAASPLYGKKVNHTGVYQSQHRLLMHLNHHPNCSQVEIARELEISPAAVAVSLKKLESGGYITREITESDSRTHRVTITKKGRSVIERSEQMFWETEKAMFEGFSEEEMQSLQQFLERIYENLLRDQQKEE